MTYNILCVDDEVANLDSIERCLRKSYTIFKAQSGPEALKILEKETIHIIISDQRMPEMTGVEFLAEAIKIQPDAMRILQTGFADLESVIESINKGEIYRYVTKPWEPQDFANTVNQALDVYKMRQTIQQQNQDLTKANQELQTLDKLKTDFMLLVNHELRTPLTAITSYSQLLQEENIAPEHKTFLQKIDKNCDRLLNLIQDTLLITKLNAKSKDVELQTTDVHKMLIELWNEFSKHYGDKSTKMSYEGESPFNQQTSPELLKTALQKIVRNVFQHAVDGSTVEFQLKSKEGGWSLIAKNQMAKKIEKTPEQLLNAFSRNENILNHTGGSGLGLAVIQSVMQVLKGKVTLNFTEKDFEIELSF